MNAAYGLPAEQRDAWNKKKVASFSALQAALNALTPALRAAFGLWNNRSRAPQVAPPSTDQSPSALTISVGAGSR